VHAWKLRSQPGYAANHVLKRDAGVCASCSLDCVELLTELKIALLRQRKAAGLSAPPEWDVRAESFDLRECCFADRVRELGLTGERARLRRRLWEMDHVIPVVEGGGSCGLENLRTLCWACHKRVTAELRARLSVARKAGGKP
jgi:5-methylcytosine-specific restriction endonuclease McrA